jgi:hypothetical protein
MTQDEWAHYCFPGFTKAEQYGVPVIVDGWKDRRDYDGPVVYLANHMSTLETLLLPAITLTFGPLATVVKDSLSHLPFLRKAAIDMKLIPIGRKSPKEDLMTIFEKYLGDYSYSNLEAIYIDRCNTDIYVQYNTNISNNATADYYFQRLTDDAWNPILIAEQEIFAFQRRNIFVKNNFNLLSIFLYQTTPLSNWFVFQIKENYNALNYNGELYTNYNSLIPKQGEIYSDNKLVFARNLYNKTLNENSTVSTIQVPNSYLNNIDLNTKTLISETNTILINDPNVIQKNIYETLFLNYINTLNVIDEDTNEIYKDAGSYINNNINAGTDINYNNSFIAKIRINFQDNSIKIQKIFWQQIDSTHKKTAFSIYAKDYINSIDFISNDENTIYITKNMNDFNLEIGKYYTITQFLRIE